MPKRFGTREEIKWSRRHDKSELSPGHMASVQSQVFASVKEKSSWIRLLTYIWAHNRLLFSTILLETHFPYFLRGTIRKSFKLIHLQEMNWQPIGDCVFLRFYAPNYTKSHMGTPSGHEIFLSNVTASSNTRDWDGDFLRIIPIHFQSGLNFVLWTLLD
jgi:hypothetical protein